jgi:cytochrome c biogenesis protein
MLKNGKGIQPLGFSIRCDSFKAEFYNTGAPREFRSEITLLKDGAPVLQGPLTVNNPLYFEGVRIFQASYGEEAGEAVLGIRNPSGSRLVTAGRGDSFGLQGSSIQVYVLRVEKDLMRMGPAVKLAIDTPDGEVQLWVFQEIQQIMREHPGILQMAPMFNPALVAPYTFSLEGIKAKQFTGLQVNSDPGLPLVGAGAALMIFGFLVIYLMSRRQVWAKIENIGSGKVRVRVAGKSSRDPVGLERELKRVMEAIRQGVS